MKVIVLLLTICFANSAYCQSDEALIKDVITRMFDGMKKSDTSMIRLTFAPQSILQTVLKNKEGKVVIVTEPLDSFLVSISKPHKEVYDERISFDLVKIDGDLAIAWTPYKFYVGDKFSHCGVDSYQLVKLNGQWKIQYLIDTRRKQGCE